jgi:hypothetical protein
MGSSYLLLSITIHCDRSDKVSISKQCFESYTSNPNPPQSQPMEPLLVPIFIIIIITSLLLRLSVGSAMQ